VGYVALWLICNKCGLDVSPLAALNSKHDESDTYSKEEKGSNSYFENAVKTQILQQSRCKTS